MQSADKFSEALKELAVRHVQRGVQPQDYFVVGEVLIWTLDHCLLGQFDDVSKLAWLKTYSLMLKEIIPATVLEIEKTSKGINPTPPAVIQQQE